MRTTLALSASLLISLGGTALAQTPAPPPTAGPPAAAPPPSALPPLPPPTAAPPAAAPPPPAPSAYPPPPYAYPPPYPQPYGYPPAYAYPPPAEEPNRTWERKIAVVGHAAMLGGPYGMFGASLEYSPTDTFTLGAGLGIGGAGPQGAAMVRGRAPHGDRWAFAFGAGPSVGRYQPFNICLFDSCDKRMFAPAYWINLELGAEYRARSGFTMRIMPGYGVLLNPNGWRCASDSSCTGPYRDTGLFYLDIVLGGFVD